jgi:hypothetical protein
MSAFFDYIQTFYVNPDAVNNAEEIMITSVELYFKGKPSLASNISNLAGPGFSAWICEVTNDQPNPERVMNNSITTVPYDRINTSTNAMTATTISFKAPIIVKTSRSYGIVIKYDDPAFEIWYNKQNDALVATTGKTTTASQGSQGRFIGMMYKATSATDKTAYTDRDLKFKVNIAKFAVSNTSFSFVNKNYEFFTIDSTSGSFIGGETVYQDIANATGTITTSSSSTTVTGSGTTFTNHAAGQYVLIANNTQKTLVQIAGITNTTSMTLATVPVISGTGFNYKVPPVGIVDYTDYTNSSNTRLYLVDSNAANATFKFVTGTRLIGERSGASANLISMWAYSADNVTPKLQLKTSSQSSYTISYKTVNETYNLVAGSSTLLNLYNNEAQTGWDAYILSRSQEVDTGLGLTLYGTNRKSMVVNVAVSSVTTGTSFSVPYINADELDIFVYQNKVSTTTKDGTGYDTETAKNGLSESKYISKKITFAENKFAEDTLVYLTGYRPAGTSIQVYVKTHNSSDKETFDDKSWTPLEIKNNLEKYSADQNDYIEYTYGLPQYPETLSILSGNFTVQNPANAVILTTADQSATVTTGDLVRVYDPLLPDNHEVFIALSSNTTAIVVNKPISNINIIGNMAVDKLRYRNVAWNNIANDNVARYVSTSLVEYDTYNSMQLKIVLLADKTYVVPKVGQIQVIGVSA